MPVSHPFNRKYITQIVKGYECKTALDVGIGFGDIGAYLKKHIPQLVIDGIEIWASYIHPQWLNYRRVWIGDFCQFPIKPIYDAILAIDVIEHLRKDTGRKQMERLMNLAQKVFILSIPIVEYPQGAIMGNPYEVHRASWREDEILEIGSACASARLELLAKNEVIGVFKSCPLRGTK
jgi:hypothetical protein